ncbi:MAG: hypothetical protein AB4426_27540 [Xenococcaceae cyanobacterium]
MRPQKAQKIDLNTDYPCPNCSRGRLLRITLTEAFGCDRCQQIFVLEDNGQVIEQLSSTYSYKRTWCWTGHRWIAVHSGLGESYFRLALLIILVVPLIVYLLWRIGSDPDPQGSDPDRWKMILSILLAVLLSVLSPLIVWLINRR